MFSNFRQFFTETKEHFNYHPLPLEVVGPDNNLDVELRTLPNTPIHTPRANTPRLNENDDEKVNTPQFDPNDEDDKDDEEYFDPEGDDEAAENNNKEHKQVLKTEIETDNEDDDEEYFDFDSDNDDNEEEINVTNYDALLQLLEELSKLQSFKDLGIIGDKKPDSFIEVEEESSALEEESGADQRQAFLQVLESLDQLQSFKNRGIIGNDKKNENTNDQEDVKQEAEPEATLFEKLCFVLTILAAAGFSIPTAMYALVMLSAMPVKTAGENIEAWWESMSTIKKTLSIVFAGSSEYVNTKLNVEFFNIFWHDLTDNLKKCFSNGKSFFANSVATILAFGGAAAAGALAYEGLEFSKPLASTFATLNSGLFFISRYIGANRVLNRLINRKDRNLQREIIDEINRLKEVHKAKLENKLNEVVHRILQNKHASERKELTKEDFESIFKELADELDHIKTIFKNCIKEKTDTEKVVEIAGNIFDNAFATFIAGITLITFARKARAGVETFTELVTGTDYFKDLSNLFKIPIGITGGLGSAMLFGVSASDFRNLCTETSLFLYHHPKFIPYFVNDLIWNICATTGMFYVGTTIPGPTSEYNIPLNNSTYWLFGISNAIGAFLVNFTPIMRKYVERPDNKKPNLDQFIHHFSNVNLNPVPKGVLNNLSMFTPKKVKVLRVHQDAEPAPKSKQRERRAYNMLP